MKRVILLGVAVLFACSMVMAADIDVDITTSMSGDYTGDNIHVGVATDGNLTINADLQADAILIADTTVGASGTVNVDAGVTVDLATINISAGFMGVLNVEGAINLTGWMNYDGNPAQYNSGTGLYGEIHVSGSGEINGGAHFIMGGYSAGWPMVVTLSDSARMSGGVSPMYLGGTAGSATLTMSGNAVLNNPNPASGYYDNILNVGWGPDLPGSGTLIVESGNTVDFRHISVKSGGRVEYILDAAGGACLLDAGPEDEDWTGDCFMNFETGSVIAIDDSGVAGGVLVPGFAVDIATAKEWSMLKWDQFEYEVALDAGPLWGLREKPGDATTLQAFIIPEPTTMALLGLGGLLVALRRRS